MLRIAAILLTTLVVSPGHAQTSRIIGDHVGCLTAEAYDEFATAALHDDLKQAQALFDPPHRVCVSIAGREFSIIEPGLLTTKIRVYVGDASIVLWTAPEATR